ncbi:MAG: NAD+ synthase [Candidatus Methanofastidiosia archaeon]|jgi:NAD+ synthase (glutamine-hydrolysing)
MHIAVAQINTSVGDIKGNTEKIITHIKKASQKADLIIFPELTITGYPPRDLLFEPDFIQKNYDMLLKIAEICTIPCVVGIVDKKNDKLFNSAVLIKDNTLQFQHKILLPHYDVFDEKRYFTPGNSQLLYEIHGKKVGIEVCEDLWEESYTKKPTSTLQNMGADVIINISASPFCIDKIKERVHLAQKYTVNTFIYCNLVGGQDELVFDGQSFVLKNQKLVKMGNAFKEDFFIVDTDRKYSAMPLEINGIAHLFKALVLGLKDYCRKTHFEKVVLGISGGIDSSVTACIAKEAVGKDNVVGLFMPSQYTSKESTQYAQKLAENLGITLIVLPIDEIFASYKNKLKKVFTGLPEDTTEENIQARIRGNIWMAYSNKYGHLPLASGNKTELALGYCTLYGDMAGGLSVIGDVSKMQVYELAQYYNAETGNVIPETVLTRYPTAELKEGQVDPFDYNIVSPLVDLIVEERTSRKDLIDLGYNPELVDDILKRLYKNEYKRRQAAPVIKVTKKSFGIGRRYPIANEFLESWLHKDIN